VHLLQVHITVLLRVLSGCFNSNTIIGDSSIMV
jgi:hypothetical protein